MLIEDASNNVCEYIDIYYKPYTNVIDRIDVMHEIGLLFSHYLIRLSGCRSWYLGSDVPFSSVAGAVDQLNPDNLLLFIVSGKDLESASEYLDKLIPKTGPAMLFVAARKELQNLSTRFLGSVFIHSVHQLEAELENKS